MSYKPALNWALFLQREYSFKQLLADRKEPWWQLLSDWSLLSAKGWVPTCSLRQSKNAPQNTKWKGFHPKSEKRHRQLDQAVRKDYEDTAVTSWIGNIYGWEEPMMAWKERKRSQRQCRNVERCFVRANLPYWTLIAFNCYKMHFKWWKEWLRSNAVFNRYQSMQSRLITFS